MARRKQPQRKPRVAPRRAAAPAAVAPNYQYWREHGGEWPEEYEQRKKRNVAYHIQELMLSDYFAQSAPARVLEYGCGPGRHLRYLNDLPGVEVHGYDQSAAMAEGVLRWASQEWFAERIVVGEPTGRLPYPDRAFDVVFTAEVLVHTRPEDLEGVLAELVRVASWQVLHLETSHDHELHQVAHEGCWKHDLVAAYARLGRDCELLPRGYAMHTPQRVVLNRKRRLYTWPTGPIALLSRMESEIGRGWRETVEQCERERKRAESAESRQQNLGDRVSELIRQLDEAKQRARQAEVKSESHLGRLQTASEALERQSDAARERAAADAAARQKEEDRARQAEARCEAYLGRIQSLSETLQTQIAASQERAAKDAETRRRLEERASALERQVAASQDRLGKDAEARQRFEERAAAAAEARKTLEERVNALRLEQQAAAQKAASAEPRLVALQEQLEKERARAREAEARGEAYLGRLESTKEALQAQIVASQERVAKDAEARRGLEDRAAALERRVAKDADVHQQLRERVAALELERKSTAQKASDAAERVRALEQQIERERGRSRDAEARCELYLGRIQEAKEALDRQAAASREGVARDAEQRQRLEERATTLGQQHVQATRRAEAAEERLGALQDRFEQERQRSRDAEARCELYLARIGETRESLERQTTAAKALSSELGAARHDHEQSRLRLEQRNAELEREYATALEEAERRLEEEGKRFAELEARLSGAREDLERVARERSAQRREDEAKRRRLADQVKALEARHERFLASLRAGLLGTTAAAAADPQQDERVLLDRAGEARFELGYIKQRLSYRILRRLRRTLPYRLLRWLPRRNRDVVTVRALGTKHPAASDCEVWLLAARSEPGGPAVPWDFMARRGVWHRRPDPNGPYGEVLMAKRGRLRFPLHGQAPVLSFLKHPWSGRVEVRWAGRREVLDLYSPHTESLEVHPAQRPMEVPARTAEPVSQAAPASTRAESASPAPLSPRRSREPFTPEDRRWLESMHREGAQVLALHVPRWLGVTSSTRILFDHCLGFPRSAAHEPYHVGPKEIRTNVELILASGVRHVVASGGDEIHFKVLRELKRRDPGIRCDLLWHASYVQMTEDYQWALLRLWVEAARDGIVDTVGTVKQGMEQFFERAGIRSRFVMNYVPEIPRGPSVPREGGPHIGIWISGNSYRKLPYAMLAAVKLIPGAVLHGSNFVKRVREAIELFEIPVYRPSQTPLPQAEMLEAIRETHATLYVTFSECSPMLPLESLSVGTPCLVGPTSHLFEDDDTLRSRLVVPAPDRADVIAEWTLRAIQERDAIVRAYMRWAPAYNERARKSLEEFLRG